MPVPRFRYLSRGETGLHFGGFMAQKHLRFDVKCGIIDS